ncbi:MAG: imidazoleglycerol-phosphate dehydratase HisB [Clostridiales bacterium]|uniref:imidazoleglycerol-phosphate dehydratase HisB n=1 Tax=Terrisporobacter sp. TaxID=1965305 RepID=UPI002A57AFFE|nr:imidazoleglycerol-phosphate dehydratase HisB [Terrisporobacter sp.]MDD7756426.1 imidazoleglycerol-phosphate dehydratase HisB [Clostridiales bacterium]MDY4136661.1 imidazoleglycerol-phosphate dehydratase HisB [Terrisporobacter sp.]MDY4737299.1 imidazoleglycerol-phosphate dehydratase HisB [Terrisporobacter sp.]
MRKGIVIRNTLETKIKVEINLDGSGEAKIDTGVGFLDHMLTLMAFHGKFDLTILAKGDLCVDDHHTIEDIGICLGEAFKEAIGDRRGIRRYSTVYIPMDESLAYTSIDISNRPYLVFNVNFSDEKIGNMSTQMFKEFFRAFVNESRITLHINLLYGENDHHKIEAVFKSFARALKEGSEIISKEVSSSKGVL